MSYGCLGVEVDSSLREEQNWKTQRPVQWSLEEDSSLREVCRKLPCGVASPEVEEDMIWKVGNTRWLVSFSVVANRILTVAPSPLVWLGEGTL